MLYVRTFQKQADVYAALEFSLEQWVIIHGALCTSIVFADDDVVKKNLMRLLDDIEFVLKRNGVVDDEDLEPIHKVIRSKRRCRKVVKWLRKK